MNDVNIKDLLEKYWSAETTLEEEEMIRNYHQSGQLPDDPANMLFNYFENEKSKSYARELKIETIEPKRTNWRFMLSIAASIMLLAAVFFSLDRASTANQKTIEDPEQALEITMTALGIMNGSMAKGEIVVKDGLQQFDKTRIFNTIYKI